MTEHPEIPPQPASAEKILRYLSAGGRAAVTIRSRESKQHVSLVFSVRKYAAEGSGGKFVPRNTKKGRVGIADGDVIEVRDPSVEYPDNYVGRFYLGSVSGEPAGWRAGRSADPIRAWVAERVFEFALAGVDRLTDQADVLLAVQCRICGRPLRDPVSIEREEGTECFGKGTGSKRAKDQLALEGGEESGEDFNRRWAEHKNEFARREAEQERAAYAAEMNEERRAHEAYVEEVAKTDESRASHLATIRQPWDFGEEIDELPPCMACGRPDDHGGRCAI